MLFLAIFIPSVVISLLLSSPLHSNTLARSLMDTPNERSLLTIPMQREGGLAKIGDAVGTLRGRRFMFDSDTLEKLAGSACYSSQKIEQELGFHAQHHLQDSLPDIIKSLQDDFSLKLNNVL